MSRPLPRSAVNVAAWMAGAAVSVSVGVVALTRIDDGLAGGGVQPLSPDSVTEAMTEAPTAAGGPTPPGSIVPPMAGRSAANPAAGPTTAGPQRTTSTRPTPSRTTERSFTSRGGSFVARCADGRVYLASWSPAPGYQATEVDRGPGERARVTFTGDRRQVAVQLRCVSSVPQATIGSGADHDDDHPDH